MFETPKNQIGQEVNGSPAQIWTELDVLANEIFGSSKSALEWAERYESINNNAAVSSEGAPELQGIKYPTVECVIYSIHTTHTTHTTQ